MRVVQRLREATKVMKGRKDTLVFFKLKYFSKQKEDAPFL